MKLSEDLKNLRAERPDEYTMDRFIKEAEHLEMVVDYINNNYWENPEDAIGDIRKMVSFATGLCQKN